MVDKIKFCFRCLKKILFLLIFFLFSFSLIFSLAYVENLISCFPITIITTQKEAVDASVSSLETCSLSIQNEKMAFDSSIFNHYEKLPVKDLYFYSLQAPYDRWEEIKNIDGAIAEANPYVEDVVKFYLDSKIKLWSLVFVLNMVFGMILISRTAPFSERNGRSFIAVFLIIAACYLAGSLFFLNKTPTVLFPLAILSLAILFIAYLALSIVAYRLIRTR